YQPSAGPKYSAKLRQTIRNIRKIAQAECDRYRVKAFCGKRKFHRVALNERYRIALFCRYCEHRPAEIRSDHRGTSIAGKLYRKISRSARDVENDRVRIGERRFQDRPHLSTPSLVDVRRKQVIEQVISARNARKHRPYRA